MFKLATARLVFRAMSPADLDFVAAMLASPEVMRYYPKCYTRAEAKGWIDRQVDRYLQHGHGLWLIADRTTGKPIGQVGLLLQTVDNTPVVEVAYLVDRPFWRQGFATEAALAARDYAFAILDKTEVISLIRPENSPSQGVARKLGMVPRGCVRHAGLEHLVFAISRVTVELQA